MLGFGLFQKSASKGKLRRLVLWFFRRVGKETLFNENEQSARTGSSEPIGFYVAVDGSRSFSPVIDSPHHQVGACGGVASGVAVSGLEMSQNSMRLSWTREEVDQRLQGIMQAIHQQSYDAAEEYGLKGNLVAGANIAGFVKVADAMLDQGLV